MATRSTIAMVLPNGSIQSIYCHWNGYPEGVGLTLAKHYNKRKVKQLIANGDVSSLGQFVGHKHDFNRATKVKSTTFYGRDRGEDNIESRNHATIKEWRKAYEMSEFCYLFDGKQWLYGDTSNKKMQPLLIGLLQS